MDLNNQYEKIYSHELESGRISDAGEFPRVILIDTISFCNLSCSICAHKTMKRKRGIMPWELFKKIVDEISKENKNVRVWMVFFGEALILKKRRLSIFEMIRYAKMSGLADVVLNTNANLLDAETAEKIIKSGLDGLYCGIDAFSPETYSKIRVGGDYNKTVENIQRFIKLKKTLGVEKPSIFVQFAEMDINTHEKVPFIDFWKEQGATVKIRPKISWAGLVETSNQVWGNNERWPCYWAMRSMSITDSGDVVACAVDLDARFVAGNIHKETIKQVWNGRLRELRILHSLKQFDKLPQFCSSCSDWQSARADFY